MRLQVIPLTGLNLQIPPAGSCFDRVVDNLAKGYYIYGNYEGNEALEHFLGFANYNQRTNCTGFGLIIGRKGLPVDAEGNPAPLYIGLTTLDEIAGDGIYQPGNWSKALEPLYPEDLPDPETWYWVYASFPEAPYPDTFHTLIAATDAHFAEGTENYWLWGAIEGEIVEYPRHAEAFRGWDYGGWSPIPDMLCFFTWTECEVPVCVNPSGNEGDIICGNSAYGQDPTHRYKCTGGQWVDQGYDPACGPTGCTNPTGSEGAIICGDSAYGQDPTHKYKCTSGQWVDQGYDPACVGACSNPSGAEGTVICGDSAYGQDPTHKYRCTGGQWVDQGYDADCAGGGCTDPSGNEGDIICGNSAYGQDPTHEYKCTGGQWEDLGSSPNCAPGLPDWLPYLAVIAGVGIVGVGIYMNLRRKE